MKKLLLSALAICAFTFGNAQEDKKESTGGYAKGDVFISGSFGINTANNVGGVADNKETGFVIAPRAGFFVSDNIAVGAKIGFQSDKAESGNVDTQDMQWLRAGAFGRYYFMPANQFSVFGEFGFDYVSQDNKLAAANGKSNGVDVNLGVGVSYFISNSFALEAGWGALGYSTLKNEADGAESENRFGLGLDMTDITLGLVYKF